MSCNSTYWQVLCVDGNSYACGSIKPLLNSIVLHDKRTLVTHCDGEDLAQYIVNGVNYDLILLTVNSDNKANTEDILTSLSQNEDTQDIPNILVCDKDIESLISQQILETHHVYGFVELQHLSSFNTEQLIKSALKTSDLLNKYKNQAVELISSQKAFGKLHSLTEATEVLSLSGGWEWDIEAQHLTWTNGVYFIHDLPMPTQLTAELAMGFYLTKDRLIISEAFEDAIQKEQSYDLTLSIKTHSGQIKTVRTTSRFKKSAGKLTHIYGSITDITSFTNICRKIENKSKLISGVLNGISDAVFILDQEGNILDSNPASEKIFGHSQETLIDKNISLLIPESKRVDHAAYVKAYTDKSLLGIMGKNRVIYAKKANGQEFPIEITINKIKQLDKTVYISLVRDITDRLERDERINELAFKDRVTKLKNYQSFEMDFVEELKKYSLAAERACFVQVNIQHFFKINFAYGHRFGNEVLRYIALILEEACRSVNGKVYRISGICFILMFGHSKNVEEIASEIKCLILKALLHKHNLNNNAFDLTPVVTLYSDKVANIEESARKVLSLLELCQQGRDKKNNFTVIDDKYLAKVNRELLIEQKLEQAIQNENDFYILYQPQIGVDGNIKAAEALIRWEDKDLGLVLPDEFIKIAERTGIIIPLTKWLINKCLSDIQQLGKSKVEIPISINISANHIIQTDFVSDILTPIKDSNISPELIILELTESAFTEDVYAAMLNMEELSEHGIKFSLDDFGTGYSNLGYLNQLPFSELKIDKVFVDQLLLGEQERNLLETIVTIGKVKNLSIVAEGVENKVQLDLLKTFDIDLFQGYYYSKPIHFNELVNLYKR